MKKQQNKCATHPKCGEYRARFYKKKRKAIIRMYVKSKRERAFHFPPVFARARLYDHYYQKSSGAYTNFYIMIFNSGGIVRMASLLTRTK